MVGEYRPSRKRAFENIIRNAENAFLLFMQFMRLSQANDTIWFTLDLSSANTFNSQKSKILSFDELFKS